MRDFVLNEKKWNLKSRQSLSTLFVITAQNMSEYGFSMTHVFPYKDKKQNRRFCLYAEKYESDKTRILTYFTQSIINKVKKPIFIMLGIAHI